MGSVLPWSFELPDEESHGLEGYATEAAWGRPAGRVRAVLRSDGSAWLVVGREQRVVSLDDIAWVDHSLNRVRLRLSAEQLANAPRLDRARGVAGGYAQAVRMLAVPAGLPPPPTPAGRGWGFGAHRPLRSPRAWTARHARGLRRGRSLLG